MGQLRIWPGGMANARAIGDFGAGHLLVSSPHITQVRSPETVSKVAWTMTSRCCQALYRCTYEGNWGGVGRARALRLTRLVCRARVFLHQQTTWHALLAWF